jgi:hypothetical protein
VECICLSGWKYDSSIQKQVDEKLKDMLLKLKEMIRSVWKRTKKQKKKKKSTTEKSAAESSTEEATVKEAFLIQVFAVSSLTTEELFLIQVFTVSTKTDYHLRNSFIMDSGVNAHASNQQNWFYNFWLSGLKNCMYADSNIILIEGFGLIDIIIKNKKDTCKITLLDVVYVLSLYTNLVSLWKFK